ncbi:MAG TPA: TetR/AcrR family transcriptional regulator [Candidatus Limnocylindria bacterium]
MPTPARTSLDRIVEAARSILENDGLAALTMQRVAEAVGVRPPSLYKRVRSRGELVRLAVEDVAKQLADELGRAAGSGDPRRDVRGLAQALRRFAHANPGAYTVIFSRLPDESRPDLATLAPANDAMMATAASLGGPEHALDAARLIVAWAHGFVSMELAGAFRLGGDVDAAFEFGMERLSVAIADSQLAR